ncbi:porin family protein [Pseudooceanicola sp. CBS1P-1]|uniref:Outer membrane beta-barrel protein n=1 Tax=Pseudooceanicola albus TaxID=2692189 RepID=A0A6L7FXP2_9RHOB|nr:MULTISPECIES: porin family protein [Pseudooceanicola]MBT9382322.1 porin family protein [Pseudooceanicola endophyticus]MXN16864.1 outer membrane beta-barrel protein [Pseudooceanicola albus]
MKTIFLTSAFALAAGAAAAGSYGPAKMEPAPMVATPVMAAPTADWTGPYLGVAAGVGKVEADYMGTTDDEDLNAYGVFGGYDYDMGQWVLGGELDYNSIDIDNTDDDGDLYRLRGRIGYDAGAFMPYVTLGAAWLKVDDETDNGFTYGAGVDYMINENFSIGAEITMNSFRDFQDTSGLDVDARMIQLRGSFRF